MSDDLARWIGLGLQATALGVATLGGVKAYQELRVLTRRRPSLYALIRPGLGEAEVKLVNVTGRAVVITEAAFRFVAMQGTEGLTPAFTSLERGEQLPLKLDDGGSFNLMPGLNPGDVAEVSVDCLLGDTLFQWSATLSAHQTVRNASITVSNVSLTKLRQLETA